MNRQIAFFVTALFLIAPLAIPQSTPQWVDSGYVPDAGYIPDAKTAVAVAEAVLGPVYGQDRVQSERPFTATLKDEQWTVAGTLRCPDGRGGTTTSCMGGVAIVRLSKKDARVLYMMHGK